MMQNTVKIDVLGTSYTITTAESEGYVHSLAEEIDRQVSGILSADTKLSPNGALILVALGYADSLHKAESGADNMRAQVSEYLEDAARAGIERDEAKREVERLRRQIEMMRKMTGAPAEE